MAAGQSVEQSLRLMFKASRSHSAEQSLRLMFKAWRASILRLAVLCFNAHRALDSRSQPQHRAGVHSICCQQPESQRDDFDFGIEQREFTQFVVSSRERAEPTDRRECGPRFRRVGLGQSVMAGLDSSWFGSERNRRR